MPTQDTNSDGEATFDLAEGNYRVDVVRDGYESGSSSFSIGAGESITETIALQRSEQATVTVTVTDRSTGDAIEGATVTIGGQQGTTNSAGQVTFTIDGGEYEITANIGGYVGDSTPISVNWGATRSMSLPLEPEIEPTLVDDFERDMIDPWVNTHEEETQAVIQQSSGLNSTHGLYFPAPASAEVYAGLENFPEAGGGPNNDGAWEAYVRLEETGGAADIARLDFAAQDGGDQLRWQIETDYVRLSGPNSSLDFFVSIGQGDTRILRIHEWRTDGYIDASIRDASDTMLDRQSTTFASAPTSGGLRGWTNYTTALSIDSVYLLD